MRSPENILLPYSQEQHQETVNVCINARRIIR